MQPLDRHIGVDRVDNSNATGVEVVVLLTLLLPMSLPLSLPLNERLMTKDSYG